MTRMILLATLMVAPVAATASTAPPPPPPFGWENRITANFDPPIEYVIVIEMPDNDETIQAHLDSWGDAAPSVLKQLAEDPFWKEYRSIILNFLKEADAEPDWNTVEGRLLELIVETEPSDDDTRECYDILLDLRHRNEFQALEILKKAGLKSSPRYLSIVSNVIASVTTTERLILLQTLLAAHSDTQARRRIHYSIDTLEGKLRAKLRRFSNE